MGFLITKGHLKGYWVGFLITEKAFRGVLGGVYYHWKCRCYFSTNLY